jgi:PDZ domain
MASVRLTRLRLLMVAAGIASGLMLPAHAASYFGVVVKENDRGGGALVVEVQPDSPADRAGIQPDDVIVRFGGRRIRAAYELRSALEAAAPGRPIDAGIVREGREMTLPVTFGRPEGEAGEDGADAKSSDRSGVEIEEGPPAPDVSNLTGEERAHLYQMYYDAWGRSHQRAHEEGMLEKERALVEAQQHLVEAQQHLLETQNRLLASEWDQRPQLAMARLCYQTFWQCLLGGFASTVVSEDITLPAAGGRGRGSSHRTDREAF